MREKELVLGGTGYMDIGQDSGETPLMTLVKRKTLAHERSNQHTMGAPLTSYSTAGCKLEKPPTKVP